MQVNSRTTDTDIKNGIRASLELGLRASTLRTPALRKPASAVSRYVLELATDVDVDAIVLYLIMFNG